MKPSELRGKYKDVLSPSDEFAAMKHRFVVKWTEFQDGSVECSSSCSFSQYEGTGCRLGASDMLRHPTKDCPGEGVHVLTEDKDGIIPPHFGTRSRKSLATCHPDLQRVAAEAIKHFDFTVLCGHRNKVDQEAAVASGASKLHWPKSKHNSNPSEAMDCVPHPLDWNDEEAFKAMAEVIKTAAEKIGVELDWGFDLWAFDMPHFQLRKK